MSVKGQENLVESELRAGEEDDRKDKIKSANKGKRYERDRRGNRTRDLPMGTSDVNPKVKESDKMGEAGSGDSKQTESEKGDSAADTEENTETEQTQEEREQQEAQEMEENELEMLDTYISEGAERITFKKGMREKNLNASALHDEMSFKGLDSSLKKNTAFVKKLRNINESVKEALSKEFLGLNLSKYIGEAAAAITEAKMKMTDINCAVHICSLIHQRYAEFSPALLENWQKILLTKKDDKVSNPSKLRVDLRLFGELVAAGIFTEKEGLTMMANQLHFLINNDHDEHNNLPIILSFCKHCGDDYAGLMPRKYRTLSEKFEKQIPRSEFLKPERQRACRNLIREYFTSLCKHLQNTHKQTLQVQRKNQRIIQTKGELNTTKKEEYDIMYQNYQKLLTNTKALSDLLDEEMPQLPEEEIVADSEAAVLDIFLPMRDSEFDGESGLFEDEDTKAFYENLHDLKSTIPAILYKDSIQSSKESETETEKVEEEGEGEEENKEAEDELNVEDVEKELAAVEEELEQGGEDETIPENATQAMEAEEDDADVGSSMKLLFEAYLQNLSACVNRELIDQASVEFCMSLNTKTNRRKLVRALFLVHRTRYDLLPFYGRLVATLAPCMPDVPVDLAQLLKQDFRYHVKKKDQINIESKLKTVRFIGELVKFKMFPVSEALHCIKMLLFDFKHHNIEMACALLESCGRFLYRTPESHHRTKIYLDVMMRKKTATMMDGRYSAMIENAYYFSNPPEVKLEVAKKRTPIQEYIRKLLYKDLSKITTEKILRQMRKMDWSDEGVAMYITKCLSCVWNIKYNSIHCAANLLAGLAGYYEKTAISVVDQVLEDVRVGLEMNLPKMNQRRVSTVKFLGELYNYRMVDSTVIFKTLYLFIMFGVTLQESVPSPLDPPDHLFRLRLVCVLLDTCGQYFDRGSSKKKLDYFLVYFQRYYQFKKASPIWTTDNPFPIDVVFMVRDAIENVRPNMKLFVDYEEACDAARELDEMFKATIIEAMPEDSAGGHDTSLDMEDEDEDGHLTTIHERDELDEASTSFSQLNLTDDLSTQDSDNSDLKTEGVTQDDPDTEKDQSDLQGSSEEEVKVLTGGPKLVKCAEDEDFMSAFDKMMTETVQTRAHESLKMPSVDIPLPMHLRGQKPAIPEPVDKQDDGSINFVLLTKKGNKQQLCNLDVPLTEKFATKFIEREQVERAEKLRMKQVVLDIHERQEEEDYQEMLLGLQKTVTTTRDRKSTYQHPKGVPDVDAIFGTKKK